MPTTVPKHREDGARCMGMGYGRPAMFQWETCVHVSSCGRGCWCMEKRISHQMDYCRTGDKTCLGRNRTTTNWFVTLGVHH